ncbi:DUF2304 family protein [Candidatus Gracilibacteria bacterium]|nr:DUF2304 family protein [Candidatus Gracilibacteria bacterium]
MNLLQIFFVISGIILLLISLDIAKKKKFNALHFLVFISVGVFLPIFSFFPGILNRFGMFFGLQRGADLLVYASIIFLLYFVILLLNKIESTKEDLTKLIREIALQNSKKLELNGEITFVIASYNEEKVIKNTILNLINSGEKNIIVVNDGSKDNSREVLKEFEDEIVVLHHYKNIGQGGALETGFEYIRRYGKNKFVCTYDADGQHQLKDLEKFLTEFKKDKDLEIVLGSRFIQKTQTNITLSRKVILKLGILFTYFISNLKLTDSHNGYRVFKKEVLDKLSISIDGMGHASEIIDIIAQKNIKFKEVPVDIIYSDYSISKGQKSSNAINIALKTIWFKFFR